MMLLRTIATAIEPLGLICRGGFHPRPEDGVPADDGGREAATVVLVGNAGPALWREFGASAGNGPHPLNDWTRDVLGRAARGLGAGILFPFVGPPYLPFQRWAMRAEAVHPSPIGPLIHPQFGLWHAYRGALTFAESIELPSPEPRPSPCDTCADRPCLSTCPAGAFTPGAYDVPACVGHVTSAPGADCLDEGCRARRACPVGREYIYEPAQARFHMEKFIAARRRESAA